MSRSEQRMMKGHQFIGYALVMTERAVLFIDHFWSQPEWMPKSQINMVMSFDSSEVLLVASNWICGQKKIEEFKERTDEDFEEYNP